MIQNAPELTARWPAPAARTVTVEGDHARIPFITRGPRTSTQVHLQVSARRSIGSCHHFRRPSGSAVGGCRPAPQTYVGGELGPRGASAPGRRRVPAGLKASCARFGELHVLLRHRLLREPGGFEGLVLVREHCHPGDLPRDDRIKRRKGALNANAALLPAPSLRDVRRAPPPAPRSVNCFTSYAYSSNAPMYRRIASVAPRVHKGFRSRGR